VITNEPDLRTYNEGGLRIDELTPDIQGLNIIDDLAVLTLMMGLKGRPDGVRLDIPFCYIRFWKRFGKGIRIVGGSGMAI